MLTFDEYQRRDAVGLAELVAHGQVTASELLGIAIARSEAVDPKINASSQRHWDEARHAIETGLPTAR